MQLFQTSLRALKKNKGRSFLTILGIVIGIASIIATVAIGNGAAKKVQDQINQGGYNSIQVWAGNWLAQGRVKSAQRKKQTYLKLADLSACRNQCEGIAAATPFVSSQEVVRYEKNNILTEVKGVSDEAVQVLNRSVAQGCFFSPGQIRSQKKVMVLGSKAAQELFKYDDPLGKTVLIGKIPFIVIGVLEKLKHSDGPKSPNMDVFVPITTGHRHLFKLGYNKIPAFIVSASSVDDMPRLVKQMRALLRVRRKLALDEADDFTIIDQESMRKAAAESAGTFNLFILIIASISLLVGGVGVMNIMLVSVTERRKEIGIRMAIGATGTTILKQFIIESIVLCGIGGIIGVFAGILVPHAAAFFTGWNVIITPGSIIAGFSITTLIGIFFGLYPAYKASRLDPVHCLADR